MLTIDPFEIYSIVNGTIRLDGGAMFGVVPKVLWEKISDVDDANRILLATRTLLAIDRKHGRVILTDTGCGPKWAPDKAERYGIVHDPQAVPKALQAANLSVDDVTDVVITHLHFDHNGGLTYWYDEPDGPTRLTYPKARHWIHRSQWEHANRPHLKDRVNFLSRDFDALSETGVLRFLEGDKPEGPFPGLEWFVSHGHTPGQLHPLFGSGSNRLFFLGDLVPTVSHLRLGWVMAYDLLPITTIHEKELIYRRCMADGWGLAFPHDLEIGGVAIGGTVERPVVSRTLPLEP